MSYTALLKSLPGTIAGGEDSWRTVLGTLMRQGRNSGDLPKKTRLIADLKSVGWGGRRQAVAQAYDFVMQGMDLPGSVHYPAQTRSDLTSFKARPPKSWVQTYPAQSDHWIAGAVVYTDVGGLLLKTWGAWTEHGPQTVIFSLHEIEQSWKSAPAEFVMQIDKKTGETKVVPNPDLSRPIEDYEAEIAGFITLEYAGCRHFTKGGAPTRTKPRARTTMAAAPRAKATPKARTTKSLKPKGRVSM